jgi:hypothetical protein
MLIFARKRKYLPPPFSKVQKKMRRKFFVCQKLAFLLNFVFLFFKLIHLHVLKTFFVFILTNDMLIKIKKEKI